MKDRQDFFSALNTFFDHVYVITLERAKDRHEHIQKELNGLQYELFFGKDKQNFSIEELIASGIYDENLAKRHHRYGKPMPAGMIGCSWSHRDVYQDMIVKGFGQVLILEDDVVIDEQNMTLLPNIMKELPHDWELVYFGFAEKENKPPSGSLKQAIYHLQRMFGKLNYSHRTIRNLYPRKHSPHIYKAGYHDCTHAYGITRSGAEKLVGLQTPISFFPDNLLAHAITNEIVKGYITRPKIIHQLYQVSASQVSYINQ